MCLPGSTIANMKSVRMEVFILLLSISVGTYGESPPMRMPTGKVCPVNEELCGTEHCYNPATNVCLKYSDGSGGIVCAIGDSFCGGLCLSPSSGKICATSKWYSDYEGICNPGESICRWRQCYSPATQDCIEGNYLCPKGQIMCGRECYTPSESVQCMTSTSGWGFLCSRDEQVCASVGCYNPQNKTCFENEHKLCNIGEELCWENWAGGCFSKAAGQVCLRNNVVCNIGQEVCGRKCFDPNGERICTKDDILCGREEASCGDKCFSPSSGDQCFNQKGTRFYAICRKGQSFCGYKCYDPQDGVCLTAGGWGERLCPTGNEVCGYACYNPVESQCYNDNFVCSKEEKICGTTCYKDNGTKVCHVSVLCVSGHELCGEEFCYDPLQSKCEDLG